MLLEFYGSLIVNSIVSDTTNIPMTRTVNSAVTPDVNPAVS